MDLTQYCAGVAAEQAALLAQRVEHEAYIAQINRRLEQINGIVEGVRAIQVATMPRYVAREGDVVTVQMDVKRRRKRP